MSRIDDKTRFYLERSVPQLREFEAKEIFSKDEIRTLVLKRTDFERLILSPGSTPADVLAYIAWDQSLENLRRKRCQRLKIRQSTSHSSQARMFQTYERGVLRHPGSPTLWHHYLDYVAQVKATKRWRRVMTRALRMLPNDSVLWVAAGKKAVQDGDMEGARGIFMRGCRFCTADALVWVEYARAEMGWLARLQSKKGSQDFSKTVAAITEASNKKEGGADDDGNILFGNHESEEEDHSEDDDDFGNMISLPKSMTEAGKKKPQVFSNEAVQKLEKSPALNGAIPQAIFDVAKAQPFFQAEAAETFFDMFASFDLTPVRNRIVEHVLATMTEQFPQAASTWNCQVKWHMLDLSPTDSEFPKALRTALAKMREGMAETTEKMQLAVKSLAWVSALLEKDNLDSGIQIVLEDARRRLERA